MLFLRKLLICYFKRSRHRQEETLFQASSYCFQRALTDHSQTGKFNHLSNFASFRSNSTGLQDTEVPISDGVWHHCSLPRVAQQCSLPGGPAEPQDSNGQPAQLCLHLWALHRLEMPQLSAEGGTAGQIQKLWHCEQNMLLSKFFLSFVTSSLLQSPSHPFSLLPLNALSQAIHPSPLQNSHY